MRRPMKFLAGGVLVIGAIVAAAIWFNWNQAVQIVSMGINYIRYMGAPAGTIIIEVAGSSQSMPARQDSLALAGDANAGQDDWPSYNKTLTSNRFSPLNQITAANAGDLKVLCTYDTGQYTGFTSGLLKVGGALIFTTEYDIFSINPNDCSQNWRTHEDYQAATPQGVSRGAAYLDGALFRGTQDGRVLAYDFKTGKRLWETAIADPRKGESAPAAPIAWNGLVFIGNAGGDMKGVKGRMYALDAKTGKIVWEFYLVPKTAGDVERGPQGKSSLDGSTWETPPGSPITGGATWTSYTLDPERVCFMSRAEILALTLRPACAKAAISIPVRSSFSMPKLEIIRGITRSFRRIGMIGMFPARRRSLKRRRAKMSCLSLRRTAIFMVSTLQPRPCFIGSL